MCVTSITVQCDVYMKLHIFLDFAMGTDLWVGGWVGGRVHRAHAGGKTHVHVHVHVHGCLPLMHDGQGPRTDEGRERILSQGITL